MKVNYDYYTGKDEYTDGDIELEIINYLKEYGEDGYQTVLTNDYRWPVFYHITPIRKNIINWYSFKKGAEILEIGAGMGAITGALCRENVNVTAVELSKQRATAIMERCKDKENLEIIVGNFNDIKFEKKYDYITLIGVLEYASLYTNTDNPFHDFLVQIKDLLKEDGKLLIAIENQFGLKYFTGAKEDHTAIKYDGIEGYSNKSGIRTFGKGELTNILNKAGFTNTKYYYPLPDYKLPNVIFSDDYLPDEKSIEEYTPYVSDETNKVSFDEKKAYLDIIKNGEFGFLANSFFIEASQKELNTNIDLKKQSLIKIDESMKAFYDKHFEIDRKDYQDVLKENEKLKTEINNMANSTSWKITKPIRDLRTNLKKKV